MDVYKNKKTGEMNCTNEKLDKKHWTFVKKVGKQFKIKNQAFDNKRSIKS